MEILPTPLSNSDTVGYFVAVHHYNIVVYSGAVGTFVQLNIIMFIIILDRYVQNGYSNNKILL